MIFDLEREPVPNSIYVYRGFVDKWNSFNNSIITNELLDEMFDLYAQIKIWEHKYFWDDEFDEEVSNNKERYRLKKYDFLKK